MHVVVPERTVEVVVGGDPTGAKRQSEGGVGGGQGGPEEQLFTQGHADWVGTAITTALYK